MQGAPLRGAKYFLLALYLIIASCLLSPAWCAKNEIRPGTRRAHLFGKTGLVRSLGWCDEKGTFLCHFVKWAPLALISRCWVSVFGASFTLWRRGVFTKAYLLQNPNPRVISEDSLPETEKSMFRSIMEPLSIVSCLFDGFQFLGS